jgi:Fe-S-cluster containining protein
LILKSRDGGACVHLTEDNRCRIHPVKPEKCRTFPYAWVNADSESVCPALAEIFQNSPLTENG